MAEPTSPFCQLRAFRAELYACCTRRADALTDLGDALLCAAAVPSLAHLSLVPAHRRGWGSTYAALARGRIDVERLRQLLARHPLDGGQAIYAVDATSWPRCDAECSPERGLYYHPSRHSAGQPIVAGWSYQWIAQLSFARDSWTAPVDACRLRPGDNHNQIAASQIHALLTRRPAQPTCGPVPLFVFDAGYDPTSLALGVGSAQAALLVRLRSGRCFYHDPPPRPAQATGRPRRHGAKFDTRDPATWPTPSYQHIEHDQQYGTVTVTAWAGLHAKQQLHPTRGGKRPRPILRGTLIRVQVERVPAHTRPPRILWLWWHGPHQPDLAVAWRAYVRRFDLEHTIRFAKQQLAWATPRPRHPEQADRWTWLVLAGYAQLRLARAVAADARLPWERPRPAGRLTPTRVRRGFPLLLCALGSPASAPKPCGRSPGRPPGTRSGPAPRYPAVKKAA
jgi:hypothetical protein